MSDDYDLAVIARPGVHVSAIIRQTLEAQRTDRRIYGFLFNGILIPVFPGDTEESVFERWETEGKKR